MGNWKLVRSFAVDKDEIFSNFDKSAEMKLEANFRVNVPIIQQKGLTHHQGQVRRY